MTTPSFETRPFAVWFRYYWQPSCLPSTPNQWLWFRLHLGQERSGSDPVQWSSVRVYITRQFEPVRAVSNHSTSVNRLLVGQLKITCCTCSMDVTVTVTVVAWCEVIQPAIKVHAITIMLLPVSTWVRFLTILVHCSKYCLTFDLLKIEQALLSTD